MVRSRVCNVRMLLEKLFESGDGKCTRRAAADLPVLHCPDADWQSSSIKNLDGLRLAQIVGLSPNLKPPDNRSDRLLRTGG
jgi:hypothetical protein